MLSVSAVSYHVIESQYRDAAIFQGSADGVPNDGGSQVPHVHLLGHIGGGKVNDGLLVWKLGRPGLHALEEVLCQRFTYPSCSRAVVSPMPFKWLHLIALC